MTQEPPYEALNPVLIERRLTTHGMEIDNLKVAQLQTTEQIGNMAKSIERLTEGVSKLSAIHAADKGNINERIDQVIADDKVRRELLKAHEDGRIEGANSVIVRIPTRTLVSIFSGIGVLVTVTTVIVSTLFDIFT